MITLQINRTGSSLVAVNRAASNSRNLLIIDNRMAILDDRNEAAQQGNVELLPFPWPARLLRVWSQKTIDGAHVMAGRLLDGVVFDLHLVTATEVNTAIGVGGAVDLDVQFEILKSSISGYIRAGGFVDQ